MGQHHDSLSSQGSLDGRISCHLREKRTKQENKMTSTRSIWDFENKPLEFIRLGARRSEAKDSSSEMPDAYMRPALKSMAPRSWWIKANASY
ncbi:uncharacterized protein FFMR_15872 [Fusarium fujikuroi]|nr:uncharacterized protein FFM5_15283 [Fusarium fujikuroi]SCO58716.1 uncharacterized protein FFMR_15872 [Fusarium fujikuroi]